AFCFWIVSRSSSITTATYSLTRNVSKSESGSQSRRRNTDTASITTSATPSALGSRTTTASSSSTSTPTSTSTPPTSTSTQAYSISRATTTTSMPYTSSRDFVTSSPAQLSRSSSHEASQPCSKHETTFSSSLSSDSSGTAMSLSFSHSWPQSHAVNTHTKSTTRDKSSMTSSQWHSTTSPSDLEATTTPHSTKATTTTTSLLNSSHTLAMSTLTCFPNLGSTVTMSLATTTSLTHDGSGDEVVALITSVSIFQHTISDSDGLGVGVPLSVEFTAIPVARATLMDLPIFVLNISKQDRFPTMSSTKSWRTSGVVHVASSLLSTYLNWSSLEVGESTSSEEVGGEEGGASWQVLRVSPPSSGWLDATTSPVLDRTVSLVVTMACAAPDQAVNNAVARISISIPAPGVARQLASEVKAAGGYSQIASVLAGGASSGSALGRVMATRSIVLCDAASSVSGGVIDFGLHLCRGDRNDAARSALVSNISLIAAVLCAFLVSAVLWAHGTGSSLRVAARNFCFPSSLMPVWMAVLPSSTAGATLLIAELGSTLCTGTDAVLVVIGIVISATPALSIATLWYLRARGPDAVLLCVEHPYVTPSPVKDEHLPLVEQFLLTVKHLVRRAVQRSWKWRAISRKQNSVDGRSNVTSRAPRIEYEWVVLLEYRVLLYGVVVFFSQIQCRYWSLAIVFLLVLQLGTLVVLRPLTTVFSAVHSGATLILTSLSMSFQLAYLWRQSTTSSSGGGGGSEAGLWMVNAAAVCDLAVVGVTAVKMLLDLLQLCAAVRRRVVALQDLHARQQNYHKDSLDVVDAVNCSADFDARKSNAPPSHMTMESHESFGVSAQVEPEVLQQADEKFWDSAGIARSSHRQGVGHEDAEVNDSFTAYSLEEGGRLPMDASPWGEQHEIGTSNERQKEHQYDALLFS
ncbi:transmembrane protein, putative, partial [Bodo saltans]